MITIGGKSKDKRLTAALRSPHFLKIRVRLLDLNHNYLRDLTRNFVGGQVTIDANAEVTRALDLTLFDPLGKIHIDPDSPHRTSVFIADMISIVYVVMTPDKSEVFEVPVFCGPIDRVDRDDMFLNVKCLGKESLSITNLWRARVFKKDQEKTFVIKKILTELVGETRLSINDRKAKLPNDEKLSRASKPWKVAKKIASSMGLQLFYDGRGYATLRKRSRNPVFTFTDRNMTSRPTMGYDLSTCINAVDVIGKKPKKAKKKIHYRVVADRSHPLSPWRLGRGGVPRYLWTTIQDDGIRTLKEAKEVGDRTLHLGLLAAVTVKFDGLPEPRLQEGDICEVKSEVLSTKFPIKQMTIPLVAGDDATYGYLKRHRPKGGAKAIKVKHGKGHQGAHRIGGDV